MNHHLQFLQTSIEKINNYKNPKKVTFNYNDKH